MVVEEAADPVRGQEEASIANLAQRLVIWVKLAAIEVYRDFDGGRCDVERIRVYVILVLDQESELVVCSFSNTFEEIESAVDQTDVETWINDVWYSVTS